MTDLRDTIIPKSDQLNSDELITGPMTLNITGVKKLAGDQPVAIDYKGGEGRPWKPCKGMRRILIDKWGSNGDAYVGRTVVVYRDESVLWAGKEYGGIRISHMSDVKSDFKFPLTLSSNKRILHPVKRLIINIEKLTGAILDAFKSEAEKAKDMNELKEIKVNLMSKHSNYSDEDADKLSEIYRAKSKQLREETK